MNTSRNSIIPGGLLFLLTCMFCLINYPASPALYAQSPEATLFITDIDGVWLRDLQSQIFPGRIAVLETPENRHALSNLKSIIKQPAETQKSTAGEDSFSLLRWPDLLMETGLTKEFLNTDMIIRIRLVDTPSGFLADGKIAFADGSGIYYTDSFPASDKLSAVHRALSLIPILIENATGEKQKPVIGSSASKVFHSRDSSHITENGQKAEFPNPSKARDAGYKPCRICFPRMYPPPDGLRNEKAGLAKVLSNSIHNRYLICKNEEMQNRAAKEGADLSKTPDGWDFVILESREINGISIPGKTLYLTLGLTEILETDGELAGVLAHEMAHSILNHHMKMMNRKKEMSMLDTLTAINPSNPAMDAIREFASAYLKSGWSREMEAEADRSAIFMLKMSGKDPKEYLTLLKKLEDLREPGQDSPWLSSHPSAEQRLEESEKSIGTAEKIHAILTLIEKTNPEVSLYISNNPRLFAGDPDSLLLFVESLAELTDRKAEPEQDLPEKFELVPIEKGIQDKKTEGIKPPEIIE